MENKKLKLDRNIERNYCGWYGGYDNSDSIYFCEGKLTSTAYSYEIGGVGSIELTENQTLEIYKQMKRHFEKHLL